MPCNLQAFLNSNYRLKLASGVSRFISLWQQVGSIDKFEKLKGRLGSTFKIRARFGLENFGLVPPLPPIKGLDKKQPTPFAFLVVQGD